MPFPDNAGLSGPERGNFLDNEPQTVPFKRYPPDNGRSNGLSKQHFLDNGDFSVTERRPATVVGNSDGAFWRHILDNAPPTALFGQHFLDNGDFSVAEKRPATVIGSSDEAFWRHFLDNGPQTAQFRGHYPGNGLPTARKRTISRISAPFRGEMAVMPASWQKLVSPCRRKVTKEVWRELPRAIFHSSERPGNPRAT